MRPISLPQAIVYERCPSCETPDKLVAIGAEVWCLCCWSRWPGFRQPAQK